METRIVNTGTRNRPNEFECKVVDDDVFLGFCMIEFNENGVPKYFYKHLIRGVMDSVRHKRGKTCRCDDETMEKMCEKAIKNLYDYLSEEDYSDVEPETF